MLTRHAKAYSSSFRKLSGYLQPFHRSSFLKCTLQPKIRKINKNPLFWKFRVFQSNWSWYN